MAVMDLLAKMNDKQAEAVQATEGPLLVMAGAGSGKTRVLTHRVAYLIEEKGINPWNILAITFTRSEEHTSQLQSHYSISYAVFCLKKIFFNDTATTEIYTNLNTLSLHDALPI